MFIIIIIMNELFSLIFRVILSVVEKKKLLKESEVSS